VIRRRALIACARRGRPVEATLQANLRRSPADADRLTAEGVPVRLVKGAYAEDRALAHPWGPETDGAYAELARRLPDVALATHDDALRAALPHARCELLLGVRPADAARLAAEGRDVRIYVPYGAGWFRYFMRRRAEAQGA
jgi:proline dehydrogenase